MFYHCLKLCMNLRLVNTIRSYKLNARFSQCYHSVILKGGMQLTKSYTVLQPSANDNEDDWNL